MVSRSSVTVALTLTCARVLVKDCVLKVSPVLLFCSPTDSSAACPVVPTEIVPSTGVKTDFPTIVVARAKGPNVGAIVGGVVFGFLVILAVVTLVIIFAVLL